MKVTKSKTNFTHYACKLEETEDFMNDVRVFARHKMALVPQNGNEVSFHELMRVVPLDLDIMNEIERSEVCLAEEEIE